jgi:hypothetical protein
VATGAPIAVAGAAAAAAAATGAGGALLMRAALKRKATGASPTAGDTRSSARYREAEAAGRERRQRRLARVNQSNRSIQMTMAT